MFVLKKVLIVFIPVLILIFTGCNRKKIVFEQPIITVINHTAHEVKLMIKECHEEKSSFYVIEEKLSSKNQVRNYSDRHNVTTLKLERKCYDIRAIDTNDGSVVGVQYGMHIPPEVTWVLK